MELKKKLLIGAGIVGLELLSIVPEYFVIKSYLEDKCEVKVQAEYLGLIEEKNVLLDKLVELVKVQEKKLREYDAGLK
jgi:hypothetical protein